MRTVMTAHAVNQGVFNYSLLEDVKGFSRPGQPDTFTYGKATYVAANKIDARYEGMSPLTCVENQAASSGGDTPPFVCFIKVAGVYGFPFLNHRGVAGQKKTPTGTETFSLYEPKQCSCSVTNNYCNVLDIVTGFIFFGKADGDQLELQKQFENIMDMLTKAKSRDFDPVVYDASFVSLTLGNGRYPRINTSKLSASDNTSLATLAGNTFRDRAYLFCDGKCSILSLNFYDPYLAHMNSRFRSYGQMHCQDTFSIPDTSWGNLSATTPTSLIQAYYKCRVSVQKAVLDAIGVSVGNVTVVMSTLLLIILTCAASFGLRRPEPNLPYKKNVVNAVLEEWANYLLMVRDSKAGGEEHQALIGFIATAVKPEDKPRRKGQSKVAAGDGGAGKGGADKGAHEDHGHDHEHDHDEAGHDGTHAGGGGDVVVSIQQP